MIPRSISLLCMVGLVACDTPNRPSFGDQATPSGNVVIGRPRFREIASFPLDSAAERESARIAVIRTLIPDTASLNGLLAELADPRVTLTYHRNPAVARELAEIYKSRFLAHAAQALAESRRVAQERPIKVTLGFSEDVSGKVRAIVIRPHVGSGYSLVLLPRAATSGDVALAFRALWELRDRQGDVVQEPQRVTVSGKPFKLASTRLQHYDSYLARLRGSPPRIVDGVLLSAAFDMSEGSVRHRSPNMSGK